MYDHVFAVHKKLSRIGTDPKKPMNFEAAAEALNFILTTEKNIYEMYRRKLLSYMLGRPRLS